MTTESTETTINYVPFVKKVPPSPQKPIFVICQKVSNRGTRTIRGVFLRTPEAICLGNYLSFVTICHLSKSFPQVREKPLCVICQKVSHRVHRNHC